MPTVALDDLYLLLVSSVRYALGRSTYIVGHCSDMVRRHWPELQPGMRETILRDVREALARAERDGRTLGMAMDHEVWVRLVSDLGSA